MERLRIIVFDFKSSHSFILTQKETRHVLCPCMRSPVREKQEFFRAAIFLVIGFLGDLMEKV
jgi:hypothetical protein